MDFQDKISHRIETKYEIEIQTKYGLVWLQPNEGGFNDGNGYFTITTDKADGKRDLQSIDGSFYSGCFNVSRDIFNSKTLDLVEPCQGFGSYNKYHLCGYWIYKHKTNGDMYVADITKKEQEQIVEKIWLEIQNKWKNEPAFVKQVKKMIKNVEKKVKFNICVNNYLSTQEKIKEHYFEIEKKEKLLKDQEIELLKMVDELE